MLTRGMLCIFEGYQHPRVMGERWSREKDGEERARLGHSFAPKRDEAEVWKNSLLYI